MVAEVSRLLGIPAQAVEAAPEAKPAAKAAGAKKTAPEPGSDEAFYADDDEQEGEGEEGQQGDSASGDEAANEGDSAAGDDTGENGEGEGEGDAGAEGEGQGDDETQGEEDGVWTEAQQKAFDRRMAKEVRKRKEMEASYKADIEGLRSEVQQLRGGKGDGANNAPVPMPSDVLLLANEAQLSERERELEAFQEWAQEHWEGYTSEKEGVPSYTAQEIQKRYRAAERVLTRDIPKAREVMKVRQQIEAQAAAIYPDLKNPKSQLSVGIEHFLTKMPALRQFPDIKVMIAHMLHRYAEVDKLAKEKVKAPGTGKPAPKAAPRVPLKAAPAATKPVIPAKKRAAGPDVQTFISMGGDRSALVAAVSAAIK